MKQNKETLKQFFETGDKPTQQQYADLIDSYIDAKQPEGKANRRFVIDELGEVSVASEQQVPEYTLSPISGTNMVDLLKDGVSVSQIDLTPYLDNTNLARLVSGTVDANGLATFTRDDNSTFTVDLSNLKDTVPQYQAGTNITIDNTDPLQPIINATAGSGGTTNLSYDTATRTLASSTGTDAVIPLADATNAGLQKANFYEEGTFTPILIAGYDLTDDSKKYNTVSPSGNFVRIGNMVDFWISFRNISDPTGGNLGALTIGGIPFDGEYGDQRLSSVNITKLAFASAEASPSPDNPYTNTTPSIIRGSYGSIQGTINFNDVFGFPLQNVSFNDNTSGVDMLINGRFKTNVYTP